MTTMKFVRNGKVTVELSMAEAWALHTAADNSIGDAAGYDDALACLGHPSTVRAGYRALSKLTRAIVKAGGFRVPA